MKKINLWRESQKPLTKKKKPEKKLLITLKKRAGRSKTGRITTRHKGGGAKRRYRIIDFGQSRMNMVAKIIAVEYDPNRSAFIALLEYKDGKKRYQVCPHNLKAGDEIVCSNRAEIKLGNRMRLKYIPVGTYIYNVELEPGMGGKLAKGAGTSVKVLTSLASNDSNESEELKYINLAMPSTEVRKVHKNCFASIGQVSFPEHRFIKLKKAGQSRLRGRRPVVRGSAMNPVDHPHGGGEGRTGIGLKHPKTPWGKIALGVKTRKKKNITNKYIVKRRKKKK